MKVQMTKVSMTIPKDELEKAAEILKSVEGITKYLPDVITEAKKK